MIQAVIMTYWCYAIDAPVMNQSRSNASNMHTQLGFARVDSRQMFYLRGKGSEKNFPEILKRFEDYLKHFVF